MALKKSELYSSLRQSCDELRGGMDAGQYKDYVLVLLFVKLLLKVADEARTEVTLYGREKDAGTSGLARMNMVLHNNPTALIVQGNTLTSPQFLNGQALKTFHYVVANPPFSDKSWSNGLNPQNDSFDRFGTFGTPPEKQGDYAYLLHITC